MEVQARIIKTLPKREGDGDNGHWEIWPFIIQWTEETPIGSFDQNVVAELSPKKFDVRRLAAAAGSTTRIPFTVSLRTRQYKEKYYNDVYAAPKGDDWKVETSQF
jgi:hypothetical protein